MQFACHQLYLLVPLVLQLLMRRLQVDAALRQGPLRGLQMSLQLKGTDKNRFRDYLTVQQQSKKCTRVFALNFTWLMKSNESEDRAVLKSELSSTLL